MVNELPPNHPDRVDASHFETAKQPLTFEVVPRHVKMHSISESELDAIAALSNSVHLTFFGICVGALISFFIVLSSGGIADPNQHATYVMLTFAAAILAAYFGIRGGGDYIQSKRKLRELKKSSDV